MQPDLLVQAEPFTWMPEREFEILAGAKFSGLTTAEQKALAITSTLETGHRGGFYGLSGNFDKMGLSFGLVNWNIGAGSLQPLLLDFLHRFPERWKAVFRDDADQFAALLARPTAEQLAVVNRDMNEQVIHKGKRKWVINAHWAAHFHRLADDPEFQSIQVNTIRGLFARAKYYCEYFGFRTERAFCMMFDAVSSHGKWWLFKKQKDHVEHRREVLQAKLAALAVRFGSAIPETEKLRAVAETLGETSLPEWREKVLVRKLWFLTGKHPRAKELAGLAPTDAQFTVSAMAAPGATPAAPPSPARPPTAHFDPVLDIAVLSAFAQGHRERGDLTNAVFFQRHPDRHGRPLAKSESAAVAEWRAIRDRVDQLFPSLSGEHELEVSAPTEAMVATPVLLLLLARGERDPNKLANEAFFALHRERDRRPIGRGEVAAVKQWRRLKTGVVAQLLARFQDQAVPRLVKRETAAGGTTLFYELRLGDEGPAKPLTAVFVPDGFRRAGTVDALLYLHGHKEGHYSNGAAMAIDRYFHEETNAPLREGLAQSSKNAILIAPTLGPYSQASALKAAGGLDHYLDRVLHAAATELGTGIGTAPQLRHLVLAAHSGGGVWMNQIARGSDKAVTEHVRECWGFDCFYNPGVDATWTAWAKRYPNNKLYAYHGTSGPRAVAQRLAGTAPNIVVIKAKTGANPHFDTVHNHWRERVAGAGFLDAR